MVTVIVSHEVNDFDTWKPLFVSDQAARDAAGFSFKSMYTGADNRNMVTIIFEAPSVEMVHGMMSSPELQAKMVEAGVVSVPQAMILNSVN